MLKISQLHPEADLCVARVQEAGNCALGHASQPYLDMVKDYAKKNPGKPIHLIGVSRGGPVVLNIEEQCRHLTDTPMRVNIVAGAIFGTKTMNFAKKYLNWFFKYDDAIKRELSYNSEISKALLRRVNKLLPNGVVREYHLGVGRCPPESRTSPAMGWQFLGLSRALRGYCRRNRLSEL